MVFGVIDCEHSEKNFFSEQHLKILEAIASIYAVKISKVRAERAAMEKEHHLLSIQKELLALKRSEEHTSELQSLMRISYAVFCLKKKKKYKQSLTHI